MKIIESAEFELYRENPAPSGDVNAAVEKIIADVRHEGDRAVRRYASRFDRSSPEKLELPPAAAEEAWTELERAEPDLAFALSLASDHIRGFAETQKSQFRDFETEIAPGLFTGQRVIPVERAAVYVPAGRFPLVSSVLMGLIPALTAGVDQVILSSPPLEDGIPDRRILAAACLAGLKTRGAGPRVFAMGGAQAIAALALGTETVPRVDLIAGPGNKYVAAAKRILSGEVGIDFVAGPTDVLIISDGLEAEKAADLAAADMLAQAEHDADARARLLVPDRKQAKLVSATVEKRLPLLSTAKTARLSLDAGGLIVVYRNREDAQRIANAIAPEHLELQVQDPGAWIPGLKNYGSLFIGSRAVEALGDYSAGINHTLPTSGSARFTGGLSVRHFLKTPTTLRCENGEGYTQALLAAERIARAEGLAGHAESVKTRII